MSPQQKMIADTRLFIRLGAVACIGILFYHAHIFLGFLDNPVALMVVALLFLCCAVPLPIIMLNNRKLFPQLPRSGKTILTMASLALLVHHFLMTFIFVMILNSDGHL